MLPEGELEQLRGLYRRFGASEILAGLIAILQETEVQCEQEGRPTVAHYLRNDRRLISATWKHITESQ